jgi:hypothetical protein
MNTETQTHIATVTQQWNNCGEIIIWVECICGYIGAEAPGTGCWQGGHNVPREIDATHAPLVEQAVETAAFQEWQPGGADVAVTVPA